MQILGKRSKTLLIVVAIVMLVAIGVSFAAWDNMSTVKATSSNSSTYANAKVGDIVEFGRYYQTGKKVSNAEDAEYEKTPIRWIVVDKDERTGQLTLLSERILAAGSYFGNYYYNLTNTPGFYYGNNDELDVNPYNQAYVESTARAFLNNLERRDLGGDSYASEVFKTSSTASNKATGKLLSSVGFSNRRYVISNNTYQRPITREEFRNRPATRGFYDEAFTDEEKVFIVPKTIAGYTGFRWPTQTSEPSEKTYIESVVDKVWLPSVTELNIMAVEDNNTNPSDEAGSTAFEYFKNYSQYINPVTGNGIKNMSLADALKTKRTTFAENSFAMNYSIPVYKYQSSIAISIDDINTVYNSTDHYWTRSPVSSYYSDVRFVNNMGTFTSHNTHLSYFGVRPCVILKY